MRADERSTGRSLDLGEIIGNAWSTAGAQSKRRSGGSDGALKKPQSCRVEGRRFEECGS